MSRDDRLAAMNRKFASCWKRSSPASSISTSEHADTIVINAGEPLPGSGWPLLAGMIHAWHDEARHQGEMYLLHKLCRGR